MTDERDIWIVPEPEWMSLRVEEYDEMIAELEAAQATIKALEGELLQIKANFKGFNKMTWDLSMALAREKYLRQRAIAACEPLLDRMLTPDEHDAALVRAADFIAAERGR